MTEQQQQQINEAAEQFAEALVGSYRALSERGVSAQELNAEMTQQFFVGVVDNLHRQTEEARGASQDLAEHAQRAQEATQELARESVGAYMDFLSSLFSFYRAGPRAAKKGAGEG